MTSLPCPPALWPRFSALLDTAMDLPRAERARWLDCLGEADATLKPWLARVLDSPAGADTGFLLRRPSLEPEPAFEAGMEVGPYRLQSRLGDGGMGEVWRACRADEGPHRDVALKLPHQELLGGPFRQRFARERDVLAALSHPHIAHLYDAGLSQDGHPYLALELVEGRPITEAAASLRAGLDKRLEWVRQVLGALSYAHQRLIVHRDIKPSNVLVTPEGEVKLLDFGIAKLLQPDGTQAARDTQVTARLATPAYASPEQLEGAAITVATDVFSVGVLLFELCTGHRPFVRAPVGADAEDAPLASQLADAGMAGIPVGKSLARSLRGDIDAVIAKSLALDPRDRYGSAEAFSRDLACCRDGLPVSARRVGWWRLAGKFVRRNKVGVALACVLALALAGGTAGIAWQARLAARAARHAEAEAARANAVKNYLFGLLQQGNWQKGGKSIDKMTAKEWLDSAMDHADTAFAGQPESEIDLLNTLGEIYTGQEDPARARSAGERRLALARQYYGPADPRVLDGTLDLAGSQVLFLDPAGARALLQTIRQPILDHYGPNSLRYANWLSKWADSLRITHGGREEALADSLQAVHLFETKFPGDPGYPDALYVLAGYQYDAEQYAESLASLDRRQHVLAAQGQSDPIDQLAYQTQAGNTLRRLGRYQQAEKLFLSAQASAEKIVGRQSMWYLASLTYRAWLANTEGRRQDAMKLFADAMAITVGKGASTGQVTSLRRAYGGVLGIDGDASQAIPLLEYALQQTTLHERDEWNLRITQGYLGDAYDKAGRTEAARALLQTSRDNWVRYGVADGPMTFAARERWARFLLEHGDPGNAARECNEILRIAGSRPFAAAALAEADLARVALGAGDVAAALRHSAHALGSLDAVTLDYDVRNRTDIWLARAEALLAAGDRAAAAALATRALDKTRITDAPTSPRLARAAALVEKAK